MERIGVWQLFSLIILFELGASTLFPIGIAAKQDAWIVILLSLICSFGIFFVYLNLHKMHPNKNIIQIIYSILGKALGFPLALLYTLFFFNATARSLKDFGEVINITILNKTPFFIIHLAFITVIIYILFLGFEVLGRMSQVLVIIKVSTLLIMFLLVIMSGKVDFKELLPVLGDGIAPVIKNIPMAIAFPFSEIFVFLAFLDITAPTKYFNRIVYLALLISGIMLTLSTIIMITSLGVGCSSVSTFPLIDVIRLINIENIITNLDSLSTLIVFIGGFFKEVIYFYGTIISFCYTFKIKNKKLAYIPLGIILLIYSISFETNYAEHVYIGLKIIPKFATVFYYFTIPILLYLISKITTNNSSAKTNK
ncbi:GerAB/ArcD/ProY family transporter [Paramaledivibacter caminithermalis]|jgi:spore germination protein KB|uniref:Spore germination protein KB n=1 Tax=Paramaledivibacter caminithermalis (strain DSM 15212 / CIP 107654 / DViRD3) TaxID=1121301 RepID=A0A1M6JJR1_PARC5|nr:GerAB/ArcD/ProY family transporter [Paramaledivibacter caminithermalis]SHJ46862.1 spore germination protein KB [Paramaledivibacter caminithermalis DSM 15212]